MNHKIKLVLFDLGNVIILDTEKDFEKKHGIEKLSDYKRTRYETASHQTEQGLKPTSELMRVMKWAFNLPYSEKRLEEIMVHTRLNKKVWQLLQEIKKDYRVAILTNNQKTWPSKAAKWLGISFKGIPLYNSAFIGTRKPLLKPYKYVLKKEKLKPSEVVFIDDKKENVMGAKKVGMHGLQFKGNVNALKQGLKKLGIEAKIKRK